MVERKCE